MSLVLVSTTDSRSTGFREENSRCFIVIGDLALRHVTGGGAPLPPHAEEPGHLASGYCTHNKSL